jgi:nucleotide-binding universal stress UspA family protein
MHVPFHKKSQTKGTILMIRIRRILCASDFSKTSGKALTSAIGLAKTNRASLTILHAYVPLVPLVPEQYIDSNTWDRVDTETRRWVERQVAKLADKARKSGVRASATMVIGDPAQQIVRTARSKHADLIVVGTHGRRGFSKFFLGSVAERVIATAPCPVMTVRGK